MALVFVHQGDSPYLEFTLRQARAAAPDDDLVLLGDPSNDHFPFLRHVDTTAPAYEAAGAEIARVYRHLTTNGHTTALRWLQRWFWLRTFLRETGTARAVTLDSDVLLFAPEAELVAPLADARFAGGLPADQSGYRWEVGPQVTVWPAATVEAFCDFALRSYTDPALGALYDEKWAYHVAHNLPGGVIDMTTLYLFVRDEIGIDAFVNLEAAREVGGERVAVDHNLSTAENEVADEYAMDGGFKQLRWVDGRPVGRNVRLGADVRFQALHLQGHAKARIPDFYRGPDFEGAAAVRRSLRAHFAARGVASRLLRPVRSLLSRLRG